MRLAPVVLLAALATACGPEAPTEYGDETRANLLTACAADTDRPIVGDVCTCTYRAIRSRIPYDRFVELDHRLRAEPDAPLPAQVVDLLAGCIVEVGDL